MAKKLSLLLAAVAVLAFAVPSMASAAKATLPAGTLAPEGLKLTMTGKDVILKSSLLGTITCATLNLNGEIVLNPGFFVEIDGISNINPTQSGCKNGEKKVTVTQVVVRSIKAEQVKAAGETAEVTASFTSTVDVGELKCTFSTGTIVKGTYVSGTNVLKFNEAAGVVGSPTQCGTAKLTGEFVLDAEATVLILD